MVPFNAHIRTGRAAMDKMGVEPPAGGSVVWSLESRIDGHYNRHNVACCPSCLNASLNAHPNVDDQKGWCEAPKFCALTWGNQRFQGPSTNSTRASCSNWEAPAAALLVPPPAASRSPPAPSLPCTLQVSDRSYKASAKFAEHGARSGAWRGRE